MITLLKSGMELDLVWITGLCGLWLLLVPKKPEEVECLLGGVRDMGMTMNDISFLSEDTKLNLTSATVNLRKEAWSQGCWRDSG